MLIHVNVKIPSTVTTSESLKVCKDFIFQHLSFYELLKFHAQFLLLPDISIMLFKARKRLHSSLNFTPVFNISGIHT